MPGGEDTLSDARTRVAALYEAHRDGIYRFLVGQGLHPPVAQEVTQEVFMDLFVSLQKGVQTNSEQGWLYTVAGRAAVDHWRRDHTSLWTELDASPGLAANLPSADITPEDHAAHSELLTRVAAGLRNLPAEQRLCIQLRRRGLRYREIAKVLGVATSTAAEWLLAAVDRLKEAANG
jgi:RNA polymerase sigma factor (sigma-70 family)